ncbi:MAG: leukotoxin [Verrucomicrobiota bacterium]|jgi:VCBS repeat-containing protein
MALGISLNLKLKEGEKVTLGQPSSKGSTELTFTGATPIPGTVITVSGLSNGKFFVNGVAKSSFTYADYLAGKVQFVHNGSEFAPKFTLSAKIGGSTVKFIQPVDSVHFENVNDAAVVIAKRIAIKEGVLTTLSSSSLSIKDAEQTSSQLKITLKSSAFEHYEIYKSGSLLSDEEGNNSFTYADVVAGKIKFRLMAGHYDSATNIAFTVDDQTGASNSRVDGHVLIQLKTATINVNSAPVVTPSAEKLSMALGGSSQLHVDSFPTVADDHGAPPAGLLVTVTKSAGVYFTIHGVKTPTFTMQDVAEGLVFINHDPKWTASLDFTLKFTDDMGKSSVTYSSSQLFQGGLNLDEIIVTGDAAIDNVVEHGSTLSGDLDAAVAAQPGLTFTYVLKTGTTYGTVVITDPATGAFTYVNDVNADTDSFVVTITASNGMTVDQVVIIDIVPENLAPTAPNVSLTIDEDSVAAITVLGSDPEGGPVSYSIETSPASGVVVATDANGHFSYTPASNFNGTDSFVVRIQDAGGKFSTATVTVTVDPINDAPVFTSPASYTVAEGSPLSGTLTATDLESSEFIYAATSSGPVHGTLSVLENGSFTYTPASNFAGTDSFVVSVSDGTDTTLQTITVTVTDDNADAPTGLLLTPSAVLEGAVGVDIGTLLGLDPDLNSSFTYELVNTAGSLEIVNGNLLRLKSGMSLDNTLDNGSSDLLSVQIKVKDGQNHESVQTVNISIADALRGPVFSTTAVTTDEDVIINGQLVASPAAGELVGAISYSKVTGPAHGNLTVNSDGSYVYTPAANYNGADSFVVRATSGSGAGTVSSTQTVSVTVNPVNDLPSLSVSSFSVPENLAGGSTIANLLSTDADANDTASFYLYSDLSGKFEIVGSALRLKAGESLDFESQSVYNLTVRVSDGNGDSVDVAVAVQVTNVNESPLAITLTPELADSATGLALVNENLLGGVVGTLSSTDADGSGDSANHVYSVNDARFEVVNKVLKLKSSAALDFELTQSLSLTVTATDLGGLRTSQSFTILVGDQDDLPHADKLQLNLDERVRNSDGSYAVDATMLHASMAGKVDSAIVFKITSLPNASTYFRLNGVKVAEFTQADVNAGKVTVVLDGTSMLPEIKISLGYRDLSGSGFGAIDFLPVEFTYGAFNTATLLDLNYEITGTAADATLGQSIWGDANYFLVGANEYRNSSGDFPEDILIGDNQSSDDRAGNVHAETLDGSRVSAAAVPGGKFVAKMSFYDAAAAGYQYNAEYLLNVNGAAATFFALPDSATPYTNGGSYSITGASVTAANAGDFDKRGLNDLIIADSKADVAGTDGVVRTDAGGAFLVWAEGNTAGAGAANTLAFVANKTDKSTHVQILGAKAGDQTGAALAGNLDMNGDGFSELAITAPMFDSAVSADVGAVYLLRGSSVTPTIDLAQGLGSNGIRIIGAEANGHIGNILLSGNYDRNFNLATANDRYGDLLIAAKDVDGSVSGQAERTDSGEVYLVWGSNSVYNADIKLDSTFTGLRIVGAKAGDALGSSMINAGDLNGDGFQDLFIGASGVDIGGKSNAGAVYVIWGGTHLKTAGKVIDLAKLDSSEGFAIYGEAAGDLFGSTIALGGDLNDDGVQELLVGGRNNGNANDGKVTVIDGALLKAIGKGAASGHALSYAGDSQDNTFAYDATTDYLVGAQGRGGFDTLAITGSNADVTIQRFNLSGIDLIDLNAEGRQSVTLDRRDVVQIGDGFDINSYSLYLDSLASQQAAGGAIVIPEDHFSTALRINRAAADGVNLQSFHRLSYIDNSNSAVNVTQVFDGITYDVYQSDTDEFAIVLIQQLPPNHAPSDLSLSPASVNENVNVDTLIGTLSATDIDAGDAHTFTVTDSRFEIRNGNQLWLKAGNAFDFESTPSVSLQITATDVGGLNVTKTISVAVNDQFERSVLKNKFELVIDERINALGEAYAEVVVTTEMLNLSANGVADLSTILVRVDSVVGGRFVNGTVNSATSFTMKDVVDQKVKFITDLSGRVPEIMVSLGVAGQAFEVSTHLPLQYSPVNYSLTNALDSNYKIIGTNKNITITNGQTEWDGTVNPANSTIIWASNSVLMIAGLAYNSGADFPEDVALLDNWDDDMRIDPEGTILFDLLDSGRINTVNPSPLRDLDTSIGTPITQMQFFDGPAQGIQYRSTFDIYMTESKIAFKGDINYDNVLDATEYWQLVSPDPMVHDYVDFTNANGFTFSSVASAGDYDKRGLNDMVIGLKNADFTGRADAGGAFLVWSEGNYAPDFTDADDGYTLQFDNPMTTDTWVFDRDTEQPKFVLSYVQILGATAGDAAGTAVAGGDMDRDTFSDVAISAPGFGANDAGAVYLLRGRSVTSTIDLANLNSSIGIKVTGANAGDQIGTSLASADFDGDGRQDLAIGSSFVDGSRNGIALSDAGEIDIVWGRDNLFTTGDINLGTGFTGTRITGGSANDQVGKTLFLYDIDGDGSQDLIIGSPNVDAAGLVDAGAVYIIWGGAALKNTSRIDLANLTVDQGIAIYGSKAGDAIGTKVVFGSDLNGDNFKELLISGNDQVHVFDGALIDAIRYNGAGVHDRPVFYSGQEQQLGTYYGDNTFSVNTDTDYLVGMDGRTGEDTLAINGLKTFTVSRFNLDGVEVLDLVQREGSGLPSVLDSQTKQTLVIDRRDPVDLIDSERQIAMVNAYSDFIRSGRVGADFSSCLRINRTAQDDVISSDFLGTPHLLEVGQQTQFQKLLDVNNNVVTQQVGATVYEVWQSTSDAQSLVLMQRLSDILGITLTGNTVTENVDGAPYNPALPLPQPGVIGTVNVLDNDADDSWTFSIAAPYDAKFEIVTTGSVGHWVHTLKLKDGVHLNFEQDPSILITITATDRQGHVKAESFTITVIDVPADITVANLVIPENVDGALISALTFTDPDHIADIASVTVSDSRFTAVKNGNVWELKLKPDVRFNREILNELDPNDVPGGDKWDDAIKGVQITVTDTDGKTFTKSFDFTIQDSDSGIVENFLGAMVSTLDLAAFEIPVGKTILAVTVNDNRFEVKQDTSGNYYLTLKAAYSLNFELEPSVTLNIQVTLNDNTAITRKYTFDVDDVSTLMTSTGNTIVENVLGAVVGNLDFVDPLLANVQSVTVNDSRFEVIESRGKYILKLKDNIALNYEALAPNYKVNLLISVTDKDGKVHSNLPLVVDVTDVNEAPYDLQFSNLSVVENAVAATIGTITVKDPDASDIWTFTVGDNRFEVVYSGGVYSLKLRDGISLDYEREQSVTFDVVVKDLGGAAGGFSYSESITVNVTNVLETAVSKDKFYLKVNERGNGGVIDVTTDMIDLSSGATADDKIVIRVDYSQGGHFTVDGVEAKVFTMADVAANKVDFVTDLSGRVPNIKLSLGVTTSTVEAAVFEAGIHLPVEYRPLNYSLGNEWDLNYVVTTAQPTFGAPLGAPVTTPPNTPYDTPVYSETWTAFSGEITVDDPDNAARAGSKWDLYTLDGVAAGTTMAIYIRHGSLFDPWVQVTDAAGNVIVEDDDTGAGNIEGTYDGVNPDNQTYDAYVTFDYQPGMIVRATTFRDWDAVSVPGARSGLGTYTLYTSAGEFIVYEPVNNAPVPGIWANSSALVINSMAYNVQADFPEDVTVWDNIDNDNRSGNIHIDSLDSARASAVTIPNGKAIVDMAFFDGPAAGVNSNADYTVYFSADTITLRADINYNGAVDVGEDAVNRLLTGGGFTSVANAGDFDNRGLDEILVGRSGATVDGREGAGGAFLVWAEGKAAADYALNFADPITTDETQYVQIIGANAGDAAGTAVAGAGDANFDGFDDILISATGFDVGGMANAGAVYLLSGLSVRATIDLADLSRNTLTNSTGTGIRILGGTANDAIGDKLASGDFDGDGYSDFVVGGSSLDGTLYRDANHNIVSRENSVYTDERSNSGEVYLIWGKQDIFSSGDISLAPGFEGTRGIRIVGAAKDDQLGTVMKNIGDIDGDGLDDLLISATGFDAPEARNAGAVYIIKGSHLQNLKADAANVDVIDLSKLTEDIGFAIYGGKNGYQLGTDVVLGSDLNGDGYRELLISGAGEVQIVDGAMIHAMHNQTRPGSAISFAGSEGADTFVLNADVDTLVGVEARGGFDTLIIKGANVRFEVSRFNMDGVEMIDLSQDLDPATNKDRAQILDVDRRDVLAIPDAYDLMDYSVFASWLNRQNSDVGFSAINSATDFDGFFENALRIKRTRADTVNLNQFHQLGYTDNDSLDNNLQPVSGFVIVTKDGVDYEVWQSDADAFALVLLQKLAPNSAPTGITITDNDGTPSTLAVMENAVFNTASAIVGDLDVVDADVGDDHTFSVSDSRFEVVDDGTGQWILRLVDGARLDRETEQSVTLTVTATDLAGVSITRAFTIAVEDDPAEQVPGVNKNVLLITESQRVNGATLITNQMIQMTPLAGETNDQLLIRIDQNYVGFAFQYTDGAVVALATSNVNLSGLTTIDGRALNAGERVLLVGQTDASQDGLYTVSTGAWTRVVGEGEIANLKGDSYQVTGGTLNGGHSFALSTDGAGLKATADSFTYAQVLAGKVSLLTDGTGIAPDIKVSFGSSTAGFNSSDYLAVEMRMKNYNMASEFDLNYKITGSAGRLVGTKLGAMANDTGFYIIDGEGLIYTFIDSSADFPEDVNIWDNLTGGNALVDPNTGLIPGMSNGLTDDRADNAQFGLHLDALDANRGTFGDARGVSQIVDMDFFDTLWDADNDLVLDDRIAFTISLNGGRIQFDASTVTNGIQAATNGFNAAHQQINYNGIGDGLLAQNGFVALPFAGTSIANAGDYDNRGQDDLIVGMAAASVPGADGVQRAGAGAVIMLWSEGRRAVDDYRETNDNNQNGVRQGLDGNPDTDTWNAGADDGEWAYYNDSSAEGTAAGAARWAVAIGHSGLQTTDESEYVQILGAAAGDRAGSVVAGAGDLNHDGFDEFLVAAQGVDANGNADAGVVYILRGQSVRSTIDLALMNTNLGVKVIGDEVNGQIGNAMMGDDFDGDGYSDVIIAGQQVDGNVGSDPDRGDSGEVYILWGQQNFFQEDINLAPAEFASKGLRIVGAAAGDFFGSAMTRMDINNDGQLDFVISAKFADANGKTDVGAVYVIYGGTHLKGLTTIDTADLGTLGFAIFGESANEHFGSLVSKGADLNNDGIDELLVSSVDYNNGAGRVHVIDGALLRGMQNDHAIAYTGTLQNDTYTWNTQVDYLVGFEGRGGVDTLVIAGNGNIDDLEPADGVNDTVDIQRFNLSGLDIIDLRTDAGAQRIKLDRRDVVTLPDAYKLDDVSIFLDHVSRTPLAQISIIDQVGVDNPSIFESALRIRGSATDVVDLGFVENAFTTPDDGFTSRDLFRRMSFAPIDGGGARTFVQNVIDGVVYDVWQSRVDTFAVVLIESGVRVLGDDVGNIAPAFNLVAQAVATPEDQAFNGTSPAADVNAGTTLAYIVAIDGTHGSVTINAATGAWTYTPDTDFNGVDTFTVGVSDGFDSATQVVTVTVSSVDDAPAGTDKIFAILAGQSRVLTAADFGFTDPKDGLAGNAVPANTFASVLVTAIPNVAVGSVTVNGVAVANGATITLADINNGLVSFVPAALTANSATFTFQVRDNGSAALPNVNLDASPNTLTFNVDVNHAPVAVASKAITNVGMDYVYAASDFKFTDADGNGLSKVKITAFSGTGTLKYDGSAITVPQEVTLADFTGGKLVYTPAAGSGTDLASLSFQVVDNGGTAGVDAADTSANTAVLSMDVRVNNAPAGTDLVVSTNEGVARTFIAADFGFTDPVDALANDANSLKTVRVTGFVGGGSLTLGGGAVPAFPFDVSVAALSTFVYTPAVNANGSAFLSFQVIDDGGGNNIDLTPNALTINILPVNDAPAGADKTVNMQEDGAYTFSAADFGFTDSNDSPSNIFSSVFINTINYGANDFNHGGSLTLNGVAVVNGQEIAVGALGSLLFRPTTDEFSGGVGNGSTYASFTFSVKDNGGTLNGGVDVDATPNTINLVVAPVAPVITSNGGGANAAITINENTTAVTTVTATDAADPLRSFSIVGGADAAKFSINANSGVLTFQVAPDFETPLDVGANNVYDVNVQVVDSAGLVDLQLLAITIRDINGA